MVRITKINPFAFRNELNVLQVKCFGMGIQKVPVDLGWWWAAFDDHDLVGYACMCPSQSFKNTAYMNRAGVLKSHRGQNIQGKFIRSRLQFAKKAGYDFVYTDTNENPPSANNLIDFGFKTMSAKDKAYQSQIVWYKDLSRKITRTSIRPKKA